MKGEAVDGEGGGFWDKVPRTESGSREKKWKLEALERGRRCNESFVGVLVLVVWG